MGRVVVGFDTETHLIRMGRKVPRMVCLTLAGRGELDRPLPAELMQRQADGEDLVVAGTPTGWTALLGRGPALEVWPALLHSATLVAQFAAYDLAVMAEAHRLETGTRDAIAATFCALEEGRVTCTKIREKLVRLAYGEAEYLLGRDGSAARTSYTLEALVRRYFGLDLSADKSGEDSWRLRYSELDGVPVASWPPEAARYAVDDALWALEVADEQLRQAGTEVDGHPLLVDSPDSYYTDPLLVGGPGTPVRVASEAREVAADFAFYCLSAWGQRTDPEAVAATVSEWRRLADASRAVGEAAGFVRVQGRDKGKAGSVHKAALQDLVTQAYERRGQEPPRTAPTKTFPEGQVRVDETTLVDSGDPVLGRYAQGLTYTNWTSKYAPVLEEGTRWPITPFYDVLKETGRTSCSNPPQQQPPREGGYREAWIPRPGWLYAGADYDTIELVALAQVNIWLGHGSAMGDAIRAGLDLHLVTAVAILNAEGRGTPEASGPWTYELAQAARKGHHGPGWAAAVSEARQLAKAANFGFPGGMQANSFSQFAHGSYGVDITPEAAQDLRETWLGAYPEMHAYFGWCDRQVSYDAGGTARQFVSGRIRGGARRTALYNGYFQGLVADGAKFSAYLLVRAGLAGEGPTELAEAVRVFDGCRPVLFLHDEVISEVPEDRAPEAAEAMATIMRWAMQRHIPDIPIGASPVLMRRWYKGADTVRDTTGRLQVWEPPTTQAAR